MYRDVKKIERDIRYYEMMIRVAEDNEQLEFFNECLENSKTLLKLIENNSI